MKIQEISELKNKPLPELNKLLKENRARLHSLRLDLVAGKVKNIGEIHGARKTIARLLTFINQKRDANVANVK